MIELTDELRKAIDEHPDEPVRLVDIQTRRAYVLVNAEAFDRLKGLCYEDGNFEVSEAYPLMDKVLAESGWDDPAMDVYDDFALKEQP